MRFVIDRKPWPDRTGDALTDECIYAINSVYDLRRRIVTADQLHALKGHIKAAGITWREACKHLPFSYATARRIMKEYPA